MYNGVCTKGSCVCVPQFMGYVVLESGESERVVLLGCAVCEVQAWGCKGQEVARTRSTLKGAMLAAESTPSPLIPWDFNATM